MAVETVWDAANVAMGVASFVGNVAAGNVGGAALDAVGIIADSAATVIPCVPGGAGTAIKLLRGADKAADLLKAADKANDIRKAADKANDVRKAADRGADLSRAGDKLNDTGRGVGQKTAKQTAEQGQSDAAKNATHGNKLDDKPAEAYTLRDRDTGEVKKFGETTRGEDRYGTGKQQRYSKKFMKENNVDYVKEQSGTKKEMHQWQHRKIVEHKEKHRKRPDLNKSDY